MCVHISLKAERAEEIKIETRKTETDLALQESLQAVTGDTGGVFSLRSATDRLKVQSGAEQRRQESIKQERISQANKRITEFNDMKLKASFAKFELSKKLAKESKNSSLSVSPLPFCSTHQIYKKVKNDISDDDIKSCNEEKENLKSQCQFQYSVPEELQESHTPISCIIQNTSTLSSSSLDTMKKIKIIKRIKKNYFYLIKMMMMMMMKK